MPAWTGQHRAVEFLPYIRDWLAQSQSQYRTATRICKMSFDDILGCKPHMPKYIKHHPMYVIVALQKLSQVSWSRT
jgi:hypothetical protein